MSLDDLINITIEADTLSPTRPGFGIIAVLASKVPTLFPTDVPKTYSDLVGMTDDGFSTSDPAYKCAAEIFAQKTRPEKIKVWARTLAKPVQEINLKVLVAGSGTVLKAKVNGTAYEVTLDNTTGATVDSAATAAPEVSRIQAVLKELHTDVQAREELQQTLAPTGPEAPQVNLTSGTL